MGDPHDPSRYGEEWDPARLAVLEAEIRAVADIAVVSGGWAWHFISPPGHRELKHAHDHKDIDLFVAPPSLGALVGRLRSRGFDKVWTRHDGKPSAEDFRRYEKRVDGADGRSVKATIDLFVSDEPSIDVGGVRVVEPSRLLSFYGSIHSSSECFAVQAARLILAAGMSPVGRPELMGAGAP